MKKTRNNWQKLLEELEDKNNDLINENYSEKSSLCGDTIETITNALEDTDAPHIVDIDLSYLLLRTIYE